MGITQADLARKLEDYGLRMDPSAITRIERGGRSIELSEAGAIANALGRRLESMIAHGHALLRPPDQSALGAAGYHFQEIAALSKKALGIIRTETRRKEPVDDDRLGAYEALARAAYTAWLNLNPPLAKLEKLEKAERSVVVDLEAAEDLDGER
jgi:transcriptional regulator with XRE-family HTH domain